MDTQKDGKENAMVRRRGKRGTPKRSLSDSVLLNFGGPTGNVAKTGKDNGIGALLVGGTESSPTAWLTELHVIDKDISVGVDLTRILWFTVELFEAADIVTGSLTANDILATTEEGSDPVVWLGAEGNTTLNANVCAGFVEGKKLRGNRIGIKATDLSPLKYIFAIFNPVRDGHGLSNARLGVSWIETVLVASTGVALTLDDVTIVEGELVVDAIGNAARKGEFDKSTTMVIPPPFGHDFLTTSKVVLSGDERVFVLACVLVWVLICE